MLQKLGSIYANVVRAMLPAEMLTPKINMMLGMPIPEEQIEKVLRETT